MNSLAKQRTLGSSLLVVLAAAAVIMFTYSANMMRFVAYGRWDPPRLVEKFGFNENGEPVMMQEPEFTDVADLGVEALQPLFVATFNVVIAALVASAIAWVVEKSFREQSFGTWSRFAIAWVLCFWAFIHVSSSIR